ncbi:MAG: phage tail length tape measure family protein [Pseudomonadota bacterium]
MTLRLSLLLNADGSQAKAEIDGLRTSQDQASTSATKLGGAARGASQGVDRLAAEAVDAQGSLRGAAAAANTYAASADRVAAGNHLAGGSVANLAAQFNDIGVMMAAGQNPLQLALQQGTQITQVIGPMGAAGAVRALRAAFVSMINPVALFTIGTIAAGAAITQWLTSAEEDAGALEDALKAINEQTTEAQTKLGVLQTGADNAAELAIIQRIAELEGEIAAARAAAEADVGRMARARTFVAQGLEQELQSLRELLDNRRAAVDALTEEEARQAAVAASARDLAASIERNAERRRAETAEAETLLQSLQQQVSLGLMIAQHGEDSAAVTRLRAQHEREAFRVMVSSMNTSQALKDELLKAFDAAAAIAATNMAAGISPAVTEAQRLAEQLGISVGLAQMLARVQAGGSAVDRNNNGLDPSDPRNPNNTAPIFSGEVGTISPFDVRRTRVRTRRGGGGGGGGVSEIDQQRRALEQLIAREREELALLRETDPVKKELLRNRETLAVATAAERAEVEQLITQRIAEAAAIEQQQRQYDFLKQTASDAFSSLIRQGEDFDDVLKNIIASLAEAAAQALLFGEGPFARSGGGGGLFGSIFGAIFPSAASPVAAAASALPASAIPPSAPRAARAPIAANMPVAPAPYVVLSPLDLTRLAVDQQPVVTIDAELRAMLRRAANTAPTIATEAARGQSAAGPSLRPENRPGATAQIAGQIREGNVTINVDARGSDDPAKVERRARDGLKAAFEEFDRDVLPGRVRQILQQPWRQ